MNRHGTMYDIGKFIRLITNMYTFGMTFLLPPAGSNNLRRLFISPSTHLEGHVSSQKSMYTILDVLSMLYVVPCCAYIVLRFVPGWTNCVQSVVTTSSGVVIGLPMELNTVFLFTYIYIYTYIWWCYDSLRRRWKSDGNTLWYYILGICAVYGRKHKIFPPWANEKTQDALHHVAPTFRCPLGWSKHLHFVPQHAWPPIWAKQGHWGRIHKMTTKLHKTIILKQTIPSRERSHIPPGKKENHLQTCLTRGIC